VQREIEDEISERILSGTVVGAQDILVDFVGGEFSFVTNSREEEPVS
jgi:ATP-dependent Clp protease ATP-binding subunit ClpC